MRKYKLFIFIFLIIFILLSVAPISYAEYSTCTDNHNPPYGAHEDPCDTPVDWDSMFESIELDDGSNLLDEDNEEYPLLYNEAAIITSDEYHNHLRDDIYLYEYVTSSAADDLEITDGESHSVEFDRNRGIVDDVHRDLEVDILTALVKIPTGTSIQFQIYDSDNTLVDVVDMEENVDEITRLSAPLDISNYDDEYSVTVELNRNSEEHDSPIIREGLF